MSNDSYITNRPFEANDESPYIFISYKHDDWREVYPIIDRFHKAGYNVWYDAALTKGQNYDIEIANKIKNSDLFITFLTERVIAGANDQEDYLVKELSVAIKKKIPRLFIYLGSLTSDDLEGYFLLNCNGIQSIFRSPYGENEDLFIDECLTTFKYHFELEQREDFSGGDLEISQNPEDENESFRPMSKMDELSEAINALSDFQQSSDDVIDRITDRVYEIYDDNARRYLADAYGFDPKLAHADADYLYSKYGSAGNSFEDRLNNLKIEKPNMRREVVNRLKALNSIGYEIADKDDEREAISEFSNSDLIGLAKYNHYVWCRDNLDEGEEYGFEGMGARYMRGVVMGSVSSDMDIIPPYRDSLLLWDELSGYEQEDNIEFANRIFEYLPSDLKITQIKIINPKSYLKDLISSGAKEIVLDCDIIFDTSDYRDIKIFDDDLVIDGNNHTIDADSKSRIFSIRGKNITIKNLTFKNGRTDRNGGAVFVHQKGSCTFEGCLFINNSSSPGLLKVKSEGGAIYNEGSCTLNSCEFTQNKGNGEDSLSNDIAPFESFKVNDCIFDSKKQKEKELAKNDIEDLKSPDFTDSANAFESDAENDIFGIKYRFRNPDSAIYHLAEGYYYALRGEGCEEFSKLPDEKYCSYELGAIKAICVAKAAGGMISSDKCNRVMDSKQIRHFKTIDEARKLFASKMKELGWREGAYDFENRKCSLYTGGGWAADKEEEIYIRILDSVNKAGFSFCKLDDAEGPILRTAIKSSDEKQIAKSEPVLGTYKNALPAEPYEGSEPYIFISYNHSDSKMVFPLIKQLSDAGFNVWYDAGINAGSDYGIQIAKSIENSSLFISMISENMMRNSSSAGDFNVRELQLAIKVDIPRLPVYLEDVALDGFYMIHYMAMQSIPKFELSDEEFIESFISASRGFGVKPNKKSSAGKSVAEAEPKKKGVMSKLFGRR